MLENVSNLSPEEVVNCINMPVVASQAINDLLDRVAELEAIIFNLDERDAFYEVNYNLIETVIHKDRDGNYDTIIEELREISNRMYTYL